MARHKHDWKLESLRTWVNASAVTVTWKCTRGRCFGYRTDEVRFRKPRNDALTDSERSERQRDLMRRKLARGSDLFSGEYIPEFDGGS